MRSFTEYFTNQTVLSSPELEQALPHMLDTRWSLPSSILPTFLHEATHHWCFTSLLGSTIALLSVRGRLRAISAARTSDSVLRKTLELEAAEDLIRAEVTRELIRPLSEGLATFAEFDVMPTTRAPAIPAPLRWVMQTCNRDLLEEKLSASEWVSRRNELTMRTWAALFEARGSTETRHRRIDMLQQPLSCGTLPDGHASAGKEGYLAGYLTVKSLWLDAVKLDERLGLSDFYLLFLYDYFYEDTELVRLLLDDSIKAPASLAPITSRVNERILYPLDRSDVEKFCSRMEAVRSAAHSDGELLFPSHPYDGKPSTHADQLWDQIITPDLVASKISPDIALFSKGLIYGRDLMCLGSLSVEARINSDIATLVLPHSEPLPLKLDADVLEQKGTFPAIVNVCISTRSGHHVVYAVNTQLDAKYKIVSVHIAPSLTKEESGVFRRAALGREVPIVINMLMNLEQEGLKKLLELSRINGYVTQTTNMLDGIYEPRAQWHIPENVLEEAIIKMRNDGVYGLLDERDDLLRAIVIMRRGSGLFHNLDWLSEEFKKEKIDFQKVISDLQAYSTRYRLFEVQTTPGINCTL